MDTTPRKPRKKRIDAGRQRKPAPSEREAWIDYFRALSPADQRYEIGYLTAVADGASFNDAPLKMIPHAGIQDGRSVPTAAPEANVISAESIGA